PAICQGLRLQAVDFVNEIGGASGGHTVAGCEVLGGTASRRCVHVNHGRGGDSWGGGERAAHPSSVTPTPCIHRPRVAPGTASAGRRFCECGGRLTSRPYRRGLWGPRRYGVETVCTSTMVASVTPVGAAREPPTPLH